MDSYIVIKNYLQLESCCYIDIFIFYIKKYKRKHND